jgi:hypothetical protein
MEAHLSAELAEVFGVLTDLHLLNLLPQTGTVPCACKIQSAISESELSTVSLPETRNLTKFSIKNNLGREPTQQKSIKYT